MELDEIKKVILDVKDSIIFREVDVNSQEFKEFFTDLFITILQIFPTAPSNFLLLSIDFLNLVFLNLDDEMLKDKIVEAEKMFFENIHFNVKVKEYDIQSFLLNRFYPKNYTDLFIDDNKSNKQYFT